MPASQDTLIESVRTCATALGAPAMAIGTSCTQAHGVYSSISRAVAGIHCRVWFDDREFHGIDGDQARVLSEWLDGN
jgi:hypothetical protein